MHDISILHHVIATFLSILSSCFHICHRLLPIAERLEVVKGAHLRLNKASLNVAVDDPCRFRRADTSGDSPAPDLCVSGREEVLQVQHVISNLHYARQDGLAARGFCKVSFLRSGVVLYFPKSLFPFTMKIV